MSSARAAEYTMTAPPVANPRERLIVALDVPTAGEALRLAEALREDVAVFKIGLQLYTAAGPEIVRAVHQMGARVFLDLKLHDIPNTVSSAVAVAGELGVAMLTVHLAGGRTMLEAAARRCEPDLLLLGVTVLTSSDDATLREIGIGATVGEQVARLAALGEAAGIRGLIASPHEVSALRQQLGRALTIITPGVRPTWAAADDQKRFTTPAEALRKGADYLVIGRPITAQPDPREAARKIISEIAEN
jgi:orotidine-5'-phosphate decarboxylase